MDLTGKLKPQEGKCESLIETEPHKYIQCNKQGRRRIHHGLDAGIHCDACYQNLLKNYHQKSE